MKKSLWGFRTVLLGIYLFFTLPVLLFTGFGIPGMGMLVWIDAYCVRPIPLYLASQVDAALYDGGELSPGFVPLWITLTGVVLWPLLFLAIRPLLWQSKRWRWGMLVYSMLWVIGNVFAANYIYLHKILDM